MKKIDAIIRKTKFEEVKDALYEAGIEFFSFWDVRGVGQAREGRVYRGIIYDTGTIERTKLSIIVRDKNAEKTVKAIDESLKYTRQSSGEEFDQVHIGIAGGWAKASATAAAVP